VLMEKNKLGFLYQSSSQKAIGNKSWIYMHSDNGNSQLGATFEYDHDKKLSKHQIGLEVRDENDDETIKKVKVDGDAKMDLAYRWRLCNKVNASLATTINLAKAETVNFKDLPISVGLDIEF